MHRTEVLSLYRAVAAQELFHHMRGYVRVVRWMTSWIHLKVNIAGVSLLSLYDVERGEKSAGASLQAMDHPLYLYPPNVVGYEYVIVVCFSGVYGLPRGLLVS